MLRTRTLTHLSRLLAVAGAALVAGPAAQDGSGPAADSARPRGAYLCFPLRERAVRVELAEGDVRVFLDGQELAADRVRELPGRVEILDEDGATPIAAVHLEARRGGFEVVHSEPRVRLGVLVGEVAERDAPEPLPKGRYRVVVTAVEPGLPADRAGLQVHDVLRSIDGESVDVDDLRAILAGKRPGEELDLRVQRGGQELELIVRLDERVESGDATPFTLPFARPAFGIGRQGRVLVWSSKHFSTEDLGPDDLAEDGTLLAHLGKTLELRAFARTEVEGHGEATAEDVRIAFGESGGDPAGFLATPARLREVEQRLAAIETKLELLLERTATRR